MEAYAEILAQDVDDVYCLSVNDAFVMRQWGISQGLEEDPTPGSLGTKTVKLLPDGACLFTRGTHTFHQTNRLLFFLGWG